MEDRKSSSRGRLSSNRGRGGRGGPARNVEGAWRARPQATFGAPGRSMPPELGISGPQRGSSNEGWRRKESRNADRVMDPMSLVASPSRGTDPSSSNSLLSTSFQQSFYAHLRRRLQAHREAYPDPLLPAIQHALELEALRTGDEVLARAKAQVTSGQQLVGEWRKLREGIVASGRTDRFAIRVYEESAELALETLDWAQLSSLLPYLVTTLHTDERSRPSVTFALEKLSLVLSKPEGDLFSEDDALIEDRHASFAAALLLLPLAMRLDLTDFCSTFVTLTSPFSSSRLSPPSTFTPLRPDHPHLVFAWQIFRIVRRGDFARLSRILRKVNLPLSSVSSRTDRVPLHHRLLYPLLPLFRRKIVWPLLQKAFYQLTDSSHIARCLSVPDDAQYDTRGESRDGQFDVGLIRLWTEKVGGVAMSEKGVLVFREVAKRPAAPAR